MCHLIPGLSPANKRHASHLSILFVKWAAPLPGRYCLLVLMASGFAPYTCVADPPRAEAPADRLTIDGQWGNWDGFTSMSLEIDGSEFRYLFSSDVGPPASLADSVTGTVRTEKDTLVLQTTGRIYDRVWHVVLYKNKICLVAERDHGRFVANGKSDISCLLFKMSNEVAGSLYFDMASLYYGADVVAEVIEESTGEVRDPRITNASVQRVYKGDLNLGDKIAIRMNNEYALPVVPQQRVREATVSERPLLPTRVAPDHSIASLVFLSNACHDVYTPLDSGVKRIMDREVLAYRPRSRFGPYSVSIRQEPELIQLPPGKPYAIAELRNDLLAARERAEAFSKACKAKDVAALEGFLSVLPPNRHRGGMSSALAVASASIIASVAGPDQVWQIYKKRNGLWDVNAREILRNVIIAEIMK